MSGFLVTSIENTLLFADAEWWKLVGGIIFFVIYGIGQILAAREEAKKKKARPPRPIPQPPQADGQAAPPNQADPLRAEVEEFLRRAKGQPAPKQQQVGKPQPPRPERKTPAPQKHRELSPLERKRHEVAEPPPKPPVRSKPQRQSSQQPPVDLRSESVVEHVARHVSTKDIADHTSHLGEEVSLADEHMEAHLHEAFSGQVGSLQHRERKVEEEGASIAEEIRNLLAQPAGMRQLIVANEILRRPEDRW